MRRAHGRGGGSRDCGRLWSLSAPARRLWRRGDDGAEQPRENRRRCRGWGHDLARGRRHLLARAPPRRAPGRDRRGLRHEQRERGSGGRGAVPRGRRRRRARALCLISFLLSFVFTLALRYSFILPIFFLPSFLDSGSLALLGPSFFRWLALFSPIWHSSAFFGLLSPSFAFFGLLWPSLALFGPLRPSSALVVASRPDCASLAEEVWFFRLFGPLCSLSVLSFVSSPPSSALLPP